MTMQAPEWADDIPAGHRSGFVAVVGRPNVGKSTLMNVLLGQKVAIVSPKPQTTRNRITGVLTRADMQVVFIDTPGLHRPKSRLGEFMVAEAWAALPDADLILWVVDATSAPGPGDRFIAATLRAQTTPVLLVLNKIDATAPGDLLARAEAYRSLIPAAVADIAMSALRGRGAEALQNLLAAHLPLGPRYFPPDQVADIQERFLAAELVREKALVHLQEEVPHGVAVEIERFETRANGTIYIAAQVWIEREAHKGILLGAGGSMIKRIGSEARQEIETALEAKVFLDLHVKVKPNWRRNPAELRRLGYA